MKRFSLPINARKSGLQRLRCAALSLSVALAFHLSPDASAFVATPGPDRLSLEEVEQLRGHEVPDAQWPALLQSLGSEDLRAAVRSLIKEQTPFPAAKLAAMLESPALAVRLGALDLLEDAAGDTFGFDPWQENPRAGANAAALSHWKTWSGDFKGAAAPAITALDDETFRTLAYELMSGDRDRSQRALERLDGFGVDAVVHIEAFLKSQPTLDEGARAALRAAEYRFVLLSVKPHDASTLARDLAFGRSDARCSALSVLAGSGSAALPVIADFLDAEDPLVRESAVDAIIAAGKGAGASLLWPRLASEKTESVLHAMIRGLGHYAKEKSQVEALAAYFKHPSENVVISAIEALAASNDNESAMPNGNTPGAGEAPAIKAFLSKALGDCLADPRWRVRATALEAIGKLTLSELASKILERLHDSDQFVRVSAVEALAAASPDETPKALLEEFHKQDDLKAPIIAAYFSHSSNRNGGPPPEVWQALEKAPPEIILQCLAMLEDRMDDGSRIHFAAPFATNPNRDVSAAALRLLASRGSHTALLLHALQSGDPVLQDAVLERLSLPRNFIKARSSADPAKVEPPGNPVLNQLYAAFTSGGAKSGSAKGSDDARPADLYATLNRIAKDGAPRQQFRAQVALASQSDPDAAAWLLSRRDSLTNAERREIVDGLQTSDWSQGPFLELATRMLRDSADEVRENAIELWLGNGKPESLAGILHEFSRPGSLLQPDDLYGWELHRTAVKGTSLPVIRKWGEKVLSDATMPDSRKVMAMVLLHDAKQVDEAKIQPFLQSPSPWLRRAAYHALGLTAVASHLDAVLADDSAMVRMVLPVLAAPNNSAWTHWFDDVHHAAAQSDSNRGGPPTVQFGAWANHTAHASTSTQALLPALEKLAHDPSDAVRFEALFALMQLGRPIDPSALASLAGSQEEEARAGSRIGEFLEQNFSRLGKGYAVLLPFAQGSYRNNMQSMQAHFGEKSANAPTSFAALAQIKPRLSAPEDLAIAPPQAQPAALKSFPFRVLFFFKSGCHECERARAMLRQQARDFPGMTLEERNIEDNRDALLDEKLSAHFELRDTLHQVTPAIFTQAGALVGDAITFPMLGDLLHKAQSLPQEASWASLTPKDVAAATETIVTRYDTMSLGVISAAGLLDGANPCAFATIVFMLSYLKVARRTPREILAVGAAFIGAVFLSSFLVGLGLSHVLSKVIAIKFLSALLTNELAAFALVVAVLSFRDAQLAARGAHGEMTLQLPGLFKEQIRSVIRVGARASRFVIAAFVAGILISFLELACTGQVYLPTILYMLRTGHASAVGYLVFYNLAFVTPLVVVFLLTWAGVRSEALIRFQKQHTALVKALTGVLFLALTAFLLFGHFLMPALRLDH